MAGLADLLRDSGRSIVGALLLGMPLLYTMETWWLGGRLGAWHLLVSTFLGLLIVWGVVHFVGFRPDHRGPSGLREATRDFTHLVLHSFVAAFVVLFLFGVVEWGDDVGFIARLGLIQVVPLGFGAAVANHAFRAGEEDPGESRLAREMALFAAGAAFFALPVAPTQEMERMAAHAGWWRMALILAASVLLTHLALYELRFRGEAGRTPTPIHQWGESFAGYLVAFATCGLLLLGFGQLHDTGLAVGAQKTVVLSFLGCLGGAAARVVV